MQQSDIIWLASYPRSGNTLLRTILWQCFGTPSASIYPNDLGGNRELENHVGHIEHSAGQVRFPPGKPALVKTHEPPTDNNPAIYVVRDGRAATVSLWNFYHAGLSLDAIIAGNHRFGTWSAHVQAWDPLTRPNTLLVRYEDLLDDLPTALARISGFLDLEILRETLPAREDIASIDGQWVRSKSDWTATLTGELLQRFNDINAGMLDKLGYPARV